MSGGADGGRLTTTANITGRTLQLPSGSHTLKLYVDHHLVGHQFGTDIIPDLNITVTTSDYLRITYPAQVTAIGANGFRAMFAGNMKAEFIKVNGSVEFLIRHGNNAIRLTSSGIQYTFDGGTHWYTASRDSSGYLKLT